MVGSMFVIRFSKQAEKDRKLLKSAGLESKAKALLSVIAENPFQDPPPYEKLLGNLDGFFSRRINIQHRLVYQVFLEKISINGKEFSGTVKVARMWTHYANLK